MSDLAKRHFYRIGEIARWLDLETHVLRFWQTEFYDALGHVQRSKLGPKGQRVFSRRQALTFGIIRELLHVELYTIEGAKRQLRLAREREKQTA